MSPTSWYFSLPKSHWIRRPFFKFGIPFMVTVIGGSFWLREFTEFRYKYRIQTQVTAAEMEELINGPGTKKASDPNEMLKSMELEVIDDYEMIRGPRPEEGPAGMAVIEEMKAKRRQEKSRQLAAAVSSNA